jgi:hypothetical protein
MKHNPDAIPKEKAVEHMDFEPGEECKVIRLHTAIDHNPAFVGGAPIAIEPDN